MCNCKGGCCIWAKILHILLLVGGLNWGLVGLGMILNTELNVVYLIFGNSLIATVVYLLVGVAAVIGIFGCRCKKCKDGVCDSASSSTPSSTGSMGQM